MGVKQPDKNPDGAFYRIYSPESFMLRPREDKFLDLKIKIDAPPQLEAWINLLPSLQERRFKTEEHNYITNTLKDINIQVHILNRHFTKPTHIKKDQIIAYLFLLGEKANDKIITEYELLYNYWKLFVFIYPTFFFTT